MASERRQITLINNQGLRGNGGGPTIIRNIVARLSPWHDVTVMSFDPPAKTTHDVTQLTLPPPKDLYWRLRPLLLARHYRTVLRPAMTAAADILIALDSHLGLAFGALPAERRVYISLSCIPRQEFFGAPVSNLLGFLQYAFLERRMIRNADLTAVASESQRREIARFERLPGFAPLILKPVFTPTDPAADCRGTGDNVGSGEIVFLTVCRLAGVKRIDRVLALAERLRNENCRFIIVGGGPLEAALQKEAENRALGGMVTFTGPSDHPEKYYRTADILLHPSAYESFGIAVFEAMCHGVIPACSRGDVTTIGIADDIAHGENGMLVDFDDMDSVVATLTPLLKDSALRRRMQQNARQQARSMLREDYVGTLAHALSLRAG